MELVEQALTFYMMPIYQITVSLSNDHLEHQAAEGHLQYGLAKQFQGHRPLWARRPASKQIRL